MREDQPSATAWRVAMRRATHQVVDQPPVFTDPLAVKMIGQVEKEEGPGFLRAFLAARSRFAEDELSRTVGRGVAQYVVLGAGLDTFAYRNPHPGLRVFEVDYPATQAWKRRRLAEVGIAIPESVTFVPVDFEKQRVDAALAGAGLRTDEATFFSWLGGTPYLDAETVLATLRMVIEMNPANGIAFDYAVPRSSMDAATQRAFDALVVRVAAVGEPFKAFFEPAELGAALRQMGYRSIDDLDAEEMTRRYFLNRDDGLRPGGGRLLCATS